MTTSITYENRGGGDWEILVLHTGVRDTQEDALDLSFLPGSGRRKFRLLRVKADLEAGTGSTVAPKFVAAQEAVSAVVADGGTGYTASDDLALVGGTKRTAAVFDANGVSGGVVTAVTIITGSEGSYSSVPANPVSVTGGTGDDCELTVTWKASTLAADREWVEATPAAAVDESPAEPVRMVTDSDGMLYYLPAPNNAATDHTIVTMLRIREGWLD